MYPEERCRHILGLLHQRERTSADEPTRTPFTSQETARHNLVALAERGLVSRFHGRTALPSSGEHENAFQTRMNEYAQEKHTVTRRATGLSGPDDSIFIGTDTIILLFVRELAYQSHLTAITDSLLIAGSVDASGNRTFMAGGGYRLESEQNVDALTIKQTARLNAEYAVIAVGALNGDGAMDLSTEEAEIAHAMVAQTRQLTVTADSSKLGRRALLQIPPLSRINRLVVDHKPTGGLQEALQQTRTEVYKAPLHIPQA